MAPLFDGEREVVQLSGAIRSTARVISTRLSSSCARHVADALVRIEAQRIAVTPAGRLLLRSIAMCFDAYLSAPRASSDPPSFSRLV